MLKNPPSTSEENIELLNRVIFGDEATSCGAGGGGGGPSGSNGSDGIAIQIQVV